MEHYGTLEEAESYLQSRGRARQWSAASANAREAALILASFYLDAQYGARFPGVRAGGIEQVLEWPRINGVLADGTPVGLLTTTPAPVRFATYEIALRELEEPGSVVRDFDPTATIKSETVGPISTTYAIPEGGGAPTVGIPVVEGLLARVIQVPPDRFMPTVV